MFGGIASRFWFSKNMINLLEPEEDLDPHFICWNMITLKLTHDKSINLIIPNQKDMNILIQFLIEQNHINKEFNEI
jgi:hypothetical protein